MNFGQPIPVARLIQGPSQTEQAIARWELQLPT